MLSSSTNLKSDVLKVGHHGSKSSTTQTFLKLVSPTFAVISVGTGNQYGHPHQVTLDKLTNAGVKVYRTDTNGTILFTSDGKTLTVKTLKNTVQPRAPTTSKTEPSKTVAPVPVPSAPSKTVTPSPEPKPEPVTPPQSSDSYIGNIGTKKFHKSSCSYLPAEKNRIYFKSKDEATSAGYVPCKRCNP